MFLVSLPYSASADGKEQGGFARFFQKVGNYMTASLMKGVDTAYIALPRNPFTAFAAYRLNSITHYMDNPYCPTVYTPDYSDMAYSNSELEMDSGYQNAFGVGIGYRNTMIKYFYKPGNKNGSTFNLSSNGRRFGGDIMYQTVNAIRSVYTIQKPKGEIPEGFPDVDHVDIGAEGGDINFSRLCINAYWVISPKRFSYPAAKRNSMIQKRSAGSFIVNATYYRTNTDLSGNDIYQRWWYLEDMHIVTNQLGFGVGYAYNIVLPWHCMLIHLSGTPMLTVNVKNHMDGYPDVGRIYEIVEHGNYPMFIHRLDELQQKFNDYNGVGFGFQGKVAVSIPISERLYASLDYTLFYLGSGYNGGFTTNTLDLTLNAMFGVRF